MSQGHVLTREPAAGVREIDFFHPQHNSIPSNVLVDLVSAIDEAGADDSVRVVIIKSGGERTFCAGASFEELIAVQDEVQGKKFFSGFANVINACRKCPKFVIGRVQGKAVGGGVGLAAAFDYTMATKFASVKLSELNIGIGPFVIGPAVERKIGVSAFSQLSINANAFQTAEWARSKGLYTEVFESAQELDEAVLNLATYLTGTNPEAMRELKRIFWEGTDHWDDLLDQRAAMSGSLVLSEQTRAMLAKYA